MSNIARVYDILGWCSLSMIKVKTLLQRLWEERVEWDEPVPHNISEVWERWQNELPMLRQCLIPCCYIRKGVDSATAQLRGFSNASELAYMYSTVVYLRTTKEGNNPHIVLVMAKTKVAPIKRLTIPRLELCAAVLSARLLNHVAKILRVCMEKIYAWTDSLVVLSWI